MLHKNLCLRRRKYNGKEMTHLNVLGASSPGKTTKHTFHTRPSKIGGELCRWHLYGSRKECLIVTSSNNFDVVVTAGALHPQHRRAFNTIFPK